MRRQLTTPHGASIMSTEFGIYPIHSKNCQSDLAKGVYTMVPRKKNTNRYVTRRPSKLYTVYEIDLQFTSTISGFSCYPTTGIVGSRPFKNRHRKVVNVLESKGLYTSSNQIQRAVNCLNKFPDPDATGVFQHYRAALECVAREVTGCRNLTLSQILKQLPDTIPDPYLREAVCELWRYVSDRGVHLREGDEPTYAEAELIDGMFGALCLYLAHKIDNVDSS